MSNKTLGEQIVQYLENHSQSPLSAEELIDALGLSGKELNEFWEDMAALEKKGTVVKTRYQTFGLPRAMGLVTGRLQVTSKGYGFVVPLEKTGDPDLFIPVSALSGAMNDDTVMARVTEKGFDNRPVGKIIRILDRAHEQFVGTFVDNGDFGFVIPDNRRIGHDIYVRKKDFSGARDKQKVVVKITSWPDGRRNAEGKIVEILGTPGDVGLEIVSIIKDNNLALDFPEEVKNAARQVPQSVRSKELEGRKDRRDWSIITIDGVDSKDLDDAVYAEKQGDNYFLGVYIADVSYYVRPHSLIDKEAYERGTSVYLVDRVLPMLPVALSNGICSLNEGEDRLTMSCEMLISGKSGKVLSYDIAPAVIRSAHRMNYPDVTSIVQDHDVSLMKQYADIVPMLETMAQLSRILHKMRVRRGSIEFEIPEVKIALDERKRPVDIHLRDRGIAEMMIEEFMLAANETVARHMTKHHYPFVYRVHDVPDDEKIRSLGKLMENFGVALNLEEKIKPKTLQSALSKVKGKPEEGMISTLALRSMKQAVYQTENIGHFGLASKDYTHFTSPIRRYPDLMVHRLLKAQASGKKLSKTDKEDLEARLSLAASHCSTCERAAIEAERQTDELKMAEYMVQFVGQKFDGTISGVASFGMFVQLENGIEGLVHISSLHDDYYNYNEEQYALIGENTGHTYRLGDRIRIEVLQVNVPERKIDFVLAGFSEGLKKQIREELEERQPDKEKTLPFSHDEKKGRKKKKHHGGDGRRYDKRGEKKRNGKKQHQNHRRK
jgi:ribonuclease R